MDLTLEGMLEMLVRQVPALLVLAFLVIQFLKHLNAKQEKEEAKEREREKTYEERERIRQEKYDIRDRQRQEHEARIENDRIAAIKEITRANYDFQRELSNVQSALSDKVLTVMNDVKTVLNQTISVLAKVDVRLDNEQLKDILTNLGMPGPTKPTTPNTDPNQ